MGHAAIYGVIEGVYQDGSVSNFGWDDTPKSPGAFRYEFSYETLTNSPYIFWGRDGAVKTLMYPTMKSEFSYGSTQIFPYELSLAKTDLGDNIQLEFGAHPYLDRTLGPGALKLKIPTTAFTNFETGPYIDWYVPTGQKVEGSIVTDWFFDERQVNGHFFHIYNETSRKFDVTHISIMHTDAYSAVPLPGTALLFGSALIGLGLQARRRLA